MSNNNEYPIVIKYRPDPTGNYIENRLMKTLYVNDDLIIVKIDESFVGSPHDVKTTLTKNVKPSGETSLSDWTNDCYFDGIIICDATALPGHMVPVVRQKFDKNAEPTSFFADASAL